MPGPLTGVVTVSQGTTLKKGSTKIATLTSIDGLDLQADTIETTNLESTGGYKTYVAGLREAGDVSIKGRYNYIDHNAIFTDFEDGSVDSYTIEFPDKGATNGTQWTFSAIVTNFKTGAEMGGLVDFEAKFKISGKPTLVAPV
jgi:predicted secreted protein